METFIQMSISHSLLGDVFVRVLPAVALGTVALVVIAGAYLRLRNEVRRRHHTEERLEHELALKTALLACLPHPVAAKDASLRYVEVNPAFESFFGVSKERLIGRTPQMVDFDAKAFALSEIVNLQWQAIDAMEPLTRQLQVRDAAGDPHTVLFWVIPLRNRDGGPQGVVTMHMDITEINAAREAAESVLRAKDSFLAMMSHEIRTPMNGILGFVELLQHTPLADEQRRMLALTRESGEALAQILDDILDYAKIEAGRLSITPMPLDLRGLFDSVVSLLLPQAIEKGLQLRIVTSPDVPATVRADGIRVRQILFNLLGNAIKFTDAGTVTLRARVEAREGDTATVIVEVEDTGIGISDADVKRLFAPFVQSERNSTRRFGGTGLGLSISRRLAELMEGNLALYSEEGVGTTAALHIPCTVLCERYDFPALRDRAVAIKVKDREVARTLRSCAEAAGMVVVPESQATVGCIELVEAVAEGRAPKNDWAIAISRAPKHLGLRADGDGIRLSINPLRWTAFLAAINEMLGRHGCAPQSNAPAAGVLSKLVATGPLRRVLVAEDHSINREMMKQQLHLLGYEVVLVENGEEAMRRLERESFDILLTDCHMPVCDGFELTRAIRGHARGEIRALPVVGVTATTVREEHERCIEIGMCGVVLKPTTLASLQDAIGAALGSSPDGSGAAGNSRGERHGDTSADRGLPAFDVASVSRESLMAATGGLLDSLHMLKACQDALRSDGDALRVVMASDDPHALREWCHRVGGAVSMLGQPSVDAVMDNFHRLARLTDLPAAQDAAAAVLAMFDVLSGLLAEEIEARSRKRAR